MEDRFMVVGSEACRIQTVQSILKDSEHFSLFHNKWQDIARDLQISDVRIKKWRDDYHNLNKIQLTDLVHEVIEEWVAKTGSGATLKMFIEILERNGMKIFTKTLEEAFLLTGSSTTFRKYSRLPSRLQEFLDQNKKRKRACILSCLDVQVTSEKIKELCKNYEFKEFNDFLDMVSVPSANTDLTVVVTIRSPKDMRQLLSEIAKAKQLPRLVVIISMETGKDLESLLRKHPPWKKAVRICKDLMEWDDLTAAYKQQLRESSQINLKFVGGDEEPKTFLSGQTLIDMINQKKINLFKTTIPDRLPHYIPRTILQRNSLSAKILEEKCSDIFLITGIERYELSLSVKNETTDNSSNQLRQKKVTAKFIILDDEQHFSQICEKTNEPVHWLIYELDTFKWNTSHGNMTVIQMYLEQKQDCLSEDDYFDTLKSSTSTSICISDGPGMGKSVLLARIGNKLCELYPSRTVLYVVMSEFMKYIKKEKHNIDGVKEALKNIFCANAFGKALFDDKLQSEQDVIELLLDGFDEVGSSDLALAHVVLQQIKDSLESVRLWVSSRVHLARDLENALSTLSIHIQPFSLQNQVQYLTSTWSKKDLEADQGKLKAFAHSCLESLKFRMQTAHHDIAGIPLQCRMIADIYEKGAIDYSRLDSQSTSQIPHELGSIPELYNLSIKSKIHQYQSTYGRVQLKEEKLMEMHVSLSLNELFPDCLQMLGLVLPKPGKMQEIWKVGIVEPSTTSQVKGGSKFIHQTFAEYFIAWFVFDTLTKADSFRKKILRKTSSKFKSLRRNIMDLIFRVILECQTIAFQKNGHKYSELDYFHYSVITYFLDSLLAVHLPFPIEGSAYRQLNPLLSAKATKQIAHSCATQNLFNIFNFFNEMGLFKDHEKQIFDNFFVCRTVQKCGVPFIEIAIDASKKYGCFDYVTQSYAIKEAVCRGDFSILEYLVNKRNLRRIVEEINGMSAELLHDCVRGTYYCTSAEVEQRIQIIGMLTGINIELLEIIDGDGRTPILSSPVHVRLLIKLVQLGANVLAQANDKSNVLHANYHLSNDDYHSLVLSFPEMCLKKLVHQKGNETQNLEVSPLVNVDPTHQAIESVGAKVVLSRDFRDSVLAHVISRGRSSATISKLVECGATVGWKGKNQETLLHVAGELGRLGTAVFLMDRLGFDVNVEDNNGFTPMDYVLQSSYTNGNRLETGLEMRRRGGMFKEVVDSQSKTWFHSAVEMENFESINLLLKTAPNLNMTDGNGNTALHFGVKFAHHRYNYFQITKFLLDNKANPNIQNKDEETPFHSLLRNRFADIRTFQLLKSVTDVKWSPHLATLALDFIICTTRDIPDKEFYSLLEELLSKKPDFNYADATGNSLLHNALSVGHQRAVEYLVGNKFANMNLANSHGHTPLHVASLSKYVSSKTIIYLIEHGADIHYKTVDNNNFLHLYTITGQHSSEEIHFLFEYLVANNHIDIFHAQGALPVGATPLHTSLYHLNLKSLLLLRSANVNFHTLDKLGCNILVYAIMGRKSIDVVSALIEKFGVDPKHLNVNKESLLHLLSSCGTAEAMKFILELNVLPVNGETVEGNTPLHFAPLHTQSTIEQIDVLEKCAMLVKNGADVNSVNLRHQSPIHMTALIKDKHLSFDVIMFLAENGGDLLATDETKSNFLHYFFTEASSFSAAQFHVLVEYLASKNACGLFNAAKGTHQFNKADVDGCNPLMLAMAFTEPFRRTLVLLRSNEVNLNFVDSKGNSILVSAIHQRRRTSFLSMLITGFGVNWKGLNDIGSSLLHHSAFYGNVEAMEFLLNKGGINLNGANTDGDTALHYAVNSKDADAVDDLCQLLISHGANVSLPNKEGKTPLDLAKKRFVGEHDKVDLIQLLRGK